MPETFHISANGEVKGPYFREQIKSMWDTGVLTADALYWNEGAQEWVPVSGMFAPTVPKNEVVVPAFPLPRLHETVLGDGLSLAEFDEPTLSPPQKSSVQELPLGESIDAEAWRRGLARFIDLNAFGYLALLIVPWAISALHQTAEAATICGIVFVVMASLEVLWLSVFRLTTPGKWLFGLWIEINDQAPTTVLTRRTYSVLWRSTLFFALFCWPLGYQDVKRHGTAKWDRKNGTRVLYRAVGDGRETLGVIIALAVSVWSVAAWNNLFKEFARRDTPLAQATQSQAGQSSPQTTQPVSGKDSHDAAFAKGLNDQFEAWKHPSVPSAAQTSNDLAICLLPRSNRLRRMLGDVDSFVTQMHNTPGPFTTDVYSLFQKQSIERIKFYFPELGSSESALNREFIQRNQSYRISAASFFEWPDWPLRLCRESVYALADSDAQPQTMKASVLGTFRLINNDILFDAYPNADTLNILTIENGADDDGIAKLIDPANSRTIITFAVASKSTASIKAIPYGSFRLLFGFGREVYLGTQRFVAPTGLAEFDDPFVFSTSDDPARTQSTELTATLHAVPGGNAKSTAISKAEFEQW